MKKITALFIGCLLAFSITTNAATTLINEDFEATEEISGYGVKLSGGSAEVKKVSDGAKEVKVLTLTDVSDDEGIALYKNFDKTEGVTAVEVRFRYSTAMNNFSISVGGGSGIISRVTVSATGEVSVTDGAEFKKFKDTTVRLNNWCTIRFCIYPDKTRADVRCNNEILKNLTYYQGYTEKNADYLLFKTREGKPVVEIDYYTVQNGSDLDASVQPIIPPYVDGPIPHAVPGKINVLYNGEYKFFDYQPIIKDSRVLLPFRRIFEMLGLEISYDDRTKTATGKNEDYEVKITNGSNTVYVNGVAKTVDVTPGIINNSFYVPVRFVSQSIGKNVDWEDESKTVIIND